MNSSLLTPHEVTLGRPAWVPTTLGGFLIFTIIVDILGNLLVIISVCRNKKLRNAGKWHLSQLVVTSLRTHAGHCRNSKAMV